MERSRRQPTVSTSKSGARNALDALKAAREGGTRRVATYEVKQEGALYDVVSENDYAELAAKRRAEGGDFIVDDEGRGYQDLGEDDYWNAREDGDEGEGEEAEDDGKAGKGAKKTEKGGKKRAAAEAAAEGSGNIAKMFRTAAARPAAKPDPAARAARPSHESSNALLEEILGGLGGGAKPSEAAAVGHLGAQGPLAAKAGSKPFARVPADRSALPGAAARPVGRPLSAALKPHVPPPPPQSGIELRPHAPRAQPAARQQQQQQQQPAPMEEEHGEAGADVMDAGADHTHAAAPDASPPPQPQPHAPPRSSTPPAAPSAAAAPPSAPSPSPATPTDEGPAAGGWAAMYDAAEGSDGPAAAAPLDGDVKMDEAGGEVKTEAPASPSPLNQEGLPLDADGNLPFFFLDAFENPDSRPGEVFLFGKVPAEAGAGAGAGRSPRGRGPPPLVSCCVVVKGLHRSLLVVPGREVFEDRDGRIKALEAEAAADPARKVDLLRYLHERCTETKAELRELLSRHGVKQHRMVPVRRSYAFEVDGVPHGLQYVIKVRYPASDPALPLGVAGRTFTAIFGAQQSPLEALLLKRHVKGPMWLSISGAAKVDPASHISWCKTEVTLSSSKGVVAPAPGTPLASRPAPPLTVASLSLQTLINPGSHQHEVVAVGVVHLAAVGIEAPTAKEAWNRPDVLRNFTIVRKLEGQAWPPGFEQAVAAENGSARGRANGGCMLAAQPSERALLACLLARLQALDADVLVGHNLGAGDLTTLLYRMQYHKVPRWSLLGRLKRQTFPKLTGGGFSFGGGGKPGGAVGSGGAPAV